MERKTESQDGRCLSMFLNAFQNKFDVFLNWITEKQQMKLACM